jgi:hypothetical protein
MLINKNNGKVIPNMRLRPLENKPTFKSVSEKSFNFPTLSKKKNSIILTEESNIFDRLIGDPIKKRLDSIEQRVKEFRKKVKIMPRNKDFIYLATLYWNNEKLY